MIDNNEIRPMDNTAEKLSATRRITLSDGSEYFIGLSLQSKFDKLSFTNTPSMDIFEDLDKAYVNADGHEVASLDFSFTNLQEAFGEMSKILIYYEKTSVGEPNPPVDITLVELQRIKILSELPVLSVDNTLIYNREITLGEPEEVYNFWAVYLDMAGRVAYIDGLPIINYLYGFPVHGLYAASGILEAKDLICEEFPNAIDVDKIGYTETQSLTDGKVHLNWFDFKSVPTESRFTMIFGSQLYLYDTFGRQRKVTFNDISNIERYVVYKYNPDNQSSPAHKFPLQLDYNVSMEPNIKDQNGKWSFLLQTTEASAVVTLNQGEIAAFWVGVKFGNS